MPGITGQGTTFNLPNYVGELFAQTPADTPFLSAIGGLTGGREANASPLFQWQGYDLRNADKNRQRVEGDGAQTAEQRTRFNVTNVVEIHQETVETSYTKQASRGAFNSTGSSHPGAVGIMGSNPIVDEHDWQVEQSLKQIARDVERGFVNGRFSNPATNATARKSRSIMEAITSNVADQGTLAGDGASTFAVDGLITETAHGLVADDTVTVRNISGDAVASLEEDWLYYVLFVSANTFRLATSPGGAAITFAGTSGTIDVYGTAELTKVMLLDLMQDVYDNGGLMESETATLMTNSSLKRALTKLLVSDANYQEQSRNMGGVRVTTIETDFGVLNVMLNRHMPSAALAVVSLEQCAPRFLNIPGKGFLFEEPLGKDGASDKTQIYGEIGLEYGNQATHGKVTAVHKPAAA